MEENTRNQSWFGLAMIFIGASVSVPTLILGGTLAGSMPMWKVLLTTLIGKAFIIAIMISQGFMSVDQGKPGVTIASQVFGKKGAQVVVSLLITVSALGWFGIQANVAGVAVANILAAVNVALPTWLVSLVIGLLMVMTAMFGIKYVRWLAYVGVPFLVGVTLWGLYVGLSQHNGWVTMIHYQPTGTMTMLDGVAATVGALALGAVIFGDYAQFSKSRVDVTKAAFWGVLPMGLLMTLLGAMLTIMFKSSDINSLFVAIATPVIGGAALVLATWKINAVNAYSGGIAVSTMFNIPMKYRKLTLLAIGVAGTILAIIGVMNYFTPIMNIMSAMVPPVAGVTGACYWVRHRGDPKAWAPTEGFNKVGIISWAIGAVVGVTPVILTFFPSAPQIVNIPVIGIIVAFVAYLIGDRPAKAPVTVQ